MLAVTSNPVTVDSYHPDDDDDMFLRNVGSYKSHTASHPIRWHFSDLRLSTLGAGPFFTLEDWWY
jgi:hypothetical protein